VLAVAAISVYLDDGGPVLFCQDRPGKDGSIFKLYKFRTMRKQRPGEQPGLDDAKRISKLGAFLRKTSVDELPTLFNVLRGEMSLVGPRPLLVEYLGRYSKEQARRHDVRPGITGWAQVNGRNALSWDDKFRLDVEYVDRRSMLFDLRILLQTALPVLRQSGIASNGHVSMPPFQGSTQHDGIEQSES